MPGANISGDREKPACERPGSRSQTLVTAGPREQDLLEDQSGTGTTKRGVHAIDKLFSRVTDTALGYPCCISALRLR
jgi:hypothetical protein